MFEFMEDLQVDPNAAQPFKLYMVEVEGENGEITCPTIWMRPATESNSDYFNAMLSQERNKSRGKRKSKGQKTVDDKAVKGARAGDRGIYPTTIFTRWEDMPGDVGDYTPELGEKFLEQTPDWVFDEMRKFAANAENHTKRAREELAGN